MKKTNKGFSMVELIIVIAIMAILAGALAPALIKYINKSRISTDIQTAQTIATAIQTALANETAYDDITGNTSLDGKTVSLTNLYSLTDTFGSEFKSTMGKKTGNSADEPLIKSKKDMNGTAYKSSHYAVYINATDNEVKVYIGDTTHIAFPDVDASLK